MISIKIILLQNSLQVISTSSRIPRVVEFHCEIIPVLVVRWNNRFDSAPDSFFSDWSPTITGIHNTVLATAKFSTELRHA